MLDDEIWLYYVVRCSVRINTHTLAVYRVSRIPWEWVIDLVGVGLWSEISSTEWQTRRRCFISAEGWVGAFQHESSRNRL